MPARTYRDGMANLSVGQIHPGEILLMPGGQIGDTPPLIALAASFGKRVHTLGIGAASQELLR